MRLYNTLTNSLDEFQPIETGRVRMYHCGPTVYDRVHIGNLRAFVFADTVRRAFEYLGYEVEQVMNVTDVGQLESDADEGEDKMTKGLKREGMPVTMEAMSELAKRYTEVFQEDTARLNILPPHHLPKASEHIEEQIRLIKILEDKGFTYSTSDGIYFDTSKDPEYGKLGKLGKETESRVENAEKKSSRDFALWKFNDSLGFESPWGQGFPGWHLECSAMSQKYLGEHFDIHTGGMDLAPIHHNNEIAQSENACGCEFVNYWLHNEFMNMKGAKMAKSEGNFLTLESVTEEGYSPLSYRYFLLLSHYRTPTSFSWEALEAAEAAYRRLKEFMSENQEAGSLNEEYADQFKDAIENDLNTPEALAVVWSLVKDDSVSPADKHATLLDFDKFLGLNLEYNEFATREVSDEVQRLLDERQVARLAQNWSRSDVLREEIRAHGFEVLDTDEGQKVRKI